MNNFMETLPMFLVIFVGWMLKAPCSKSWTSREGTRRTIFFCSNPTTTTSTICPSLPASSSSSPPSARCSSWRKCSTRAARLRSTNFRPRNVSDLNRQLTFWPADDGQWDRWSSIQRTIRFWHKEACALNGGTFPIQRFIHQLYSHQAGRSLGSHKLQPSPVFV